MDTRQTYRVPHGFNAALLAVALAATPAFGATEYEKHAGGLAVYMGVLPAQVLRGRASADHVATMHGGLPRGSGSHHVVISIFDERSQHRVEDAVVEAGVASPGLAPACRTLEPMRIVDTTTYGNFFPMAGAGPFVVRVTIRRPGQVDATEVQFNYAHPR